MKSLGVRGMGRGVFGGCDAHRQETLVGFARTRRLLSNLEISRKMFFFLVASVVDVRWLDFVFSSSGGLRFMRYPF